MTITTERKAQLLDKLLEEIAFSMEPAMLLMALLPDGYDVDRHEVLGSAVKRAAGRNEGQMLIEDFACTVTQGELRALLLPFAGPVLSDELDLKVSFQERPKRSD